MCKSLSYIVLVVVSDLNLFAEIQQTHVYLLCILAFFYQLALNSFVHFTFFKHEAVWCYSHRVI